MNRSISCGFIALAALVGAGPALSADEHWRCVVTVEKDLNLSYEYTITDTDVTSRANSRLTSPPTYHYKIIENSDVGLMAVTSDSWHGADGFTRDTTEIALDKRTGDFVEAHVALSEQSPPNSWRLNGKCTRD
jgi:hypothetical protein